MSQENSTFLPLDLAEGSDTWDPVAGHRSRQWTLASTTAQVLLLINLVTLGKRPDMPEP